MLSRAEGGSTLTTSAPAYSASAKTDALLTAFAPTTAPKRSSGVSGSSCPDLCETQSSSERTLEDGGVGEAWCSRKSQARDEGVARQACRARQRATQLYKAGREGHHNRPRTRRSARRTGGDPCYRGARAGDPTEPAGGARSLGVRQGRLAGALRRYSSGGPRQSHPRGAPPALQDVANNRDRSAGHHLRGQWGLRGGTIG